MIVWSSLPADPPRAAAVAFGNFDGVHRGHQALLAALREAARAVGGPAIALTFDPHPLRLLHPDRAPAAIDSPAQRLDALAAHGVDILVVLPFDAALAACPADRFATEFLFDRLGARAVIAGHDTRFGHGGAGDVALLEWLAARRGIAVVRCGAVDHAGLAVSSSRVRRAIGDGDVGLAAALLGRPWAIDGRVVGGDRRGRTLGFPTANLGETVQMPPAPGVYAAWFSTDGVGPAAAVVNCGVRPTFGAGATRIEAHLIGFDGDLYGRPCRLTFAARLRAEQRFDGVAALRDQIGRDIAAARDALALGATDPAA